jgi:hypothetical protein
VLVLLLLLLLLLLLCFFKADPAPEQEPQACRIPGCLQALALHDVLRR